MAGPIQLIPPGLLGWVQLKSDGRNPSTLGEQIAPVWDLLPWYLESTARNHTIIDSVVSGHASVGFAVFPTLLNGKNAWWVHDFTVRVAEASGDSVQFALHWENPVGGASRFVYQVSERSEFGVGPRYNSQFARKPFFLPPNSQLGVIVMVNDSTVVGNITYVAYARYSVLPL